MLNLEIQKYTKKLTLLLIEDDVNVLKSTKELFSNFFDNIITATNGEEGLEKFKTNQIDLIITDLNMPKISGLAMIEEIREINSEIPIIILSVNSNSNSFIETIKLNIQGYILKPLLLNKIIKTLEHIIKDVRLQEEKEKHKKTKEKYNKLLQTIIDTTNDCIMLIDNNYNIQFTNKSMRDKLNLDKNKKCYEIFNTNQLPCEDTKQCPIALIKKNPQKHIKMIKNFAHILEDTPYIEVKSTPIFDDENNLTGVLQMARNVTEYIQKEQELLKIAHNDKLTSVPNRHAFEKELNKFIKEKINFGLFFIDLNKFKPVNDKYGHKIGDKVLQIIAKRLQNILRDDDFVARLGGDEFVVLIKNTKNIQNLKNIATKMLEVIEEQIHINNYLINLSASIGISIYPLDTTDKNKIINFADKAMYLAKQKNINIKFYNDIKDK